MNTNQNNMKPLKAVPFSYSNSTSWVPSTFIVILTIRSLAFAYIVYISDALVKDIVGNVSICRPLIDMYENVRWLKGSVSLFFHSSFNPNPFLYLFIYLHQPMTEILLELNCVFAQTRDNRCFPHPLEENGSHSTLQHYFIFLLHIRTSCALWFSLILVCK